MALRGARLQGETYVRFATTSVEATRLEKTFKEWHFKPDMVEFKRRNIV